MHTAFIRVKVYPAHGDTPHVRAFLAEFGPVIEPWESNHTSALS
ncbi:hypothetical protein RHDE110596_10535 [Prescottella defluvii]|nr:hypothetical protein [Prescottella defluvii]